MEGLRFPDRLKGRLSPFIGVSSFQILVMFRRGLFYSYLSIYLRFYLGLSVTETTLFATIPMVINIIFQTFVWGGISDRSQKRRTLIILGELCAALITFLTWFAHRLPETEYAAGYVIILGLSVTEVFWSMSNVAWSALISDLYPARERTAVQARLASVGAAGRLVGVWIGGLAYDGLGRLYEGWGFDQGFLFFAASGVMLLSTIPMFFMPEGGAVPEDRKPSGDKTNLGGAASVSAYSRTFLMFLLALVFINFGRNCVAAIKTQYLVLDEGFDVTSAFLSHIVNMRSVAMLVGGLVIGRLARRISDENLLMSGSVIAVMSLLGFVVARGLALIVISNFLTGVGDVVIMAASYSYASRLIPALYRGRQFALFNATMFLSWGLAGTLIAGPIVDLLIRSGAGQAFSYRMAFLAGAVMVTVGIMVFAGVKSTRSPTSATGGS
jgi:MFS family permease